MEFNKLVVQLLKRENTQQIYQNNLENKTQTGRIYHTKYQNTLWKITILKKHIILVEDRQIGSWNKV